MSKEGEFHGIPFRVLKRRVKYSRIEFRQKGLQVIVPFGINPMRVLEDNKRNIIRKYQKLRLLAETAVEIDLISREYSEFSRIIQESIFHYQAKLSIKKKILIKLRKMKRRWGSCRSDGVITINKLMIFMPRNLIEYVVYHELVHFSERYHNRRFKNLITYEFPDWKELDRQLTVYGIKLLDNV